MRTAALALLLAACAAPVEPDAVPSPEHCADDVATREPGYVRVISGDMQCGGAVVADDEILTAAHCVPDRDAVLVVDMRDGAVMATGRAVEVDKRGEFARVRTDEPMPGVEPYTIAYGPPTAGIELTVVGAGCEGWLERRQLLSLGGWYAEGCACSGDSGSPVLGPSGRLLGVFARYAAAERLAIFTDVTRR